ncbi:MAG: YitT family protein [Zhenhengia sp.]|uniref:YitT family protein n=1 Tax=Zhenhengia sp. TaxID=2944208 RepID=UPI001D23D298|nr:YitT family protein [Candidatus Niameybacter stercoravium]
MSQKIKFQKILFLVILNILGTITYAIGINCFAAPHNIAPGGASGIAILINYICGFPIGTFVFLFNVPLLIWIIMKKYFPKAFVLKTLATTALLSIVTDYLVVHIPVYQGDPLLASMFGGVLMGVGLALVHLGASNTGGISLLGLIVQKLRPRFPVGGLISFLNIVVVMASGIIYKNIESLLYAVVTVYISGIFMDKILDQAAAKNLMIVISECTDKVRKALVESQKGITILKGEGGYSSRNQRIILCAATKNDCISMEKTIKEVDDQSLIIITEACKVEGKGFKHVV